MRRRNASLLPARMQRYRLLQRSQRCIVCFPTSVVGHQHATISAASKISSLDTRTDFSEKKAGRMAFPSTGHGHAVTARLLVRVTVVLVPLSVN